MSLSPTYFVMYTCCPAHKDKIDEIERVYKTYQLLYRILIGFEL